MGFQVESTALLHVVIQSSSHQLLCQLQCVGSKASLGMGISTSQREKGQEETGGGFDRPGVEGALIISVHVL